MTWSAADLVSALRQQVLKLETDLRERVDGEDHSARQPGVWQAWESDYTAAFSAQRTAATWQQWRNERVTQAAVSWVLLTVFARYCEDNGLVKPRWIGGTNADQRTQALDARRAYFQANPEHTDREWLGQIIDHFAQFQATAALVDSYSPLHLVAPSGDAARALLEFWWQQGDDGQPLYSFSGVDTRFLGDAYQDLSEYAKKTYALLQTPEFVEEFILDQTLEPALADRPLEGFTVIDPTCGSGHFLLGTFKHLHYRWQQHAPALGARELVAKALEGVYGVDINPFAIAIARFRLLVAALHAAGDNSIEDNIGYRPHLAAGDSLLWGAPQQALDDDLLTFGTNVRADTTENAAALKEILQRHHDVVVGNPPYITVKDAALNATYRELYSTCHRQYALTVPFMELFFQLAHPSGQERPAGWVGQITSNSFMKREFGSKLIETFFPRIDLQCVIDSEGAWIPGHNMDGTPTTIIFGRNRPPVAPSVRAVLSMGVRETPADAAKRGYGPYWTSIVEHVSETGHEDSYISVTELPRHSLNKHPWSLAGGGAIRLLQNIESAGSKRLGDQVSRIGFQAMSHADEEFTRPYAWRRRQGGDEHLWLPLGTGTNVRDYRAAFPEITWFPYLSGRLAISTQTIAEALRLWPMRTTLESRATFGGQTYKAAGRTWYEWHQVPLDSDAAEWSIAFAFIGTHNHFVLDRGGTVFKQSAPIIKLPAGASTEDHLRLLGVLNSSVACFWLKQNSQPKGGAAEHSWSRTYEFTGTTIKDFPLPTSTPIERPSRLDDLARDLQRERPVELAKLETPTLAALESCRKESDRLRNLMIAQQEELDWEYYRIYGLVDDDLAFDGEVPGVALGERAFEIALARKMKAGEETTAWFERHGSDPITDIPNHFPTEYRDLVQRRLDAIAKHADIRLLEKPEYKRRWAMEPWDEQVESALRGWLLDHMEARSLWFDRDGRPSPLSVAQLADVLDRDAEFCEVLRLWAGDSNATTGAALAKLLSDEAVPFLAAYRYKPSGLDKRADWEHTWGLQRREDAGERLESPIPVPPKYASTDFVKTSYWSHRGKLDVPKERFISYPNAGRDSDSSELLGWAGWDHAEQALALASLISARIDDGWDTPKLIPLLAGLHELQPWVRQWHNQIDPEWGASIADTIDDELTARMAELHLTTTDLTTWRPPAPTRGRRARTS